MTFRLANFRDESRCGLAVFISLALLGVCRDTVRASGAEGDQASARNPGPQAPLETARRFALPAGFSINLFASEPDVVQPIAMTFDHKGRLWIVENYSYPIWLGGPRGKDRILILEDADGDGRFDRRTVFWDKGTNFTGIELGFGGVWVCATPNLLFFPDRDGDDRPDGEPAIVLDGWDVKSQHNMFNGLKWGTRRLALGLQRHPVEFARRQAGHARQRPSSDQLRRLAVSSDSGGFRGRRARHDQPLGTRFRRLRRGVHHQLRDPASLSRRARRPLSANVRRGPGTQSLRADGDLRRSHPLGRRPLDRLARAAGVSTERPAAAMPTSAR